MADPIVSYLPQLSSALGVNSPAPAVGGAGTPLQRALVAQAAPLPAPTAAQLQAQLPTFTAPTAPPTAPVAPPVPVAAPKAAAPAVKLPMPKAADAGLVSPTPGVGNPLPANMRDTTADVPLPGGPMPGAANTASALAGVNLPAGATLDYEVPIQTPAGVMYGSTNPAYGGTAIPGGAAATTAAVGGAGGIRSPEGIINNAFDAQTQRAEHFIQQAMQYVNSGGDIFERATRGRFINGLLGATVGPNNIGTVQGQGQDTLNSSLANVESAGIGANASRFATETGMQENNARIAAAQHIQQQERGNTVQVIGQRTYKNALGLLTTEPIYGLPTLNAQGNATQFNPISPNGMVVRPSSPQAPANPQVGTTRTRASGAVERFDGKNWVRENAQ